MICVSISERKMERCIELAQQFEIAELRLDLSHLKNHELVAVFSACKNLIATYRTTDLASVKQKELLKLAIQSGAAYVDIEVEAPFSYKDEMIQFARKYQCKVIISYHNFEQTPAVDFMINMIDESFSYGADLVKLACKVNVVDDNARIMSLYGMKKNIIAFGMGDLAKISRIAAPLLGSPFTFACLSEKERTAPGQITAINMQQIYKMIQES